MNYYTTYTGERISRRVLDQRIHRAKEKKIAEFLEEHGYLFCEDCKRNDCIPVECSHNISVKECIESGRVELAYDVNNITLRGRKCHRKKDNSELKFSQ